MSKLDIVRAWKDEEYCESLSDKQRASLPVNPAGVIELTDVELSGAAGGAEGDIYVTVTITLPICYTLYTCGPTICLPYAL